MSLTNIFLKKALPGFLFKSCQQTSIIAIPQSLLLSSVRKVNNIELPKRPTTAFFQFVSIKYKEVLNAAPGDNSKKVMKNLAESWKSLPFEEKKLFYQMASESSRNYTNKMKEITSKMTKEELEEFNKNIKEQKVKRKEKLARYRQRKNARLTNKPKRPSVMGLYAKTLERGEASATEFVKGAAEKWKMLPEDEKEKFRQEYKEKMAIYEKEKAAWDAKMVAEGKPNFASKKFVNNLNKTMTEQIEGKEKKAKAKSTTAAKAKPTSAVKAKSAQKTSGKGTRKAKMIKAVEEKVETGSTPNPKTETAEGTEKTQA